MSWFLLTEAELSALRVSAIVALFGVGVSLAPGIACGWLLARREFRGKILLDAIVHLPLVLPPVVTGYLLLVALGRSGPIGRILDSFGVEVAFTRAAAVLAATVMGFPLLVRAVRLGIQLVDQRIEEAARTLGAGRWRVLFTVTLPLALPGVLTGIVLAFARGLGEFGATITFAGNIKGETRTIPVAVYTLMQQPGGDAAAARLVVIAVVLSLGALIVSELLARRVHATRARLFERDTLSMPTLEVDIQRSSAPPHFAYRFTTEAPITGVIGASGAGKTTLLHALAGLITPDHGVIRIRDAAGETVLFDRAAGIDLPPEQRSFGVVFQEDRLLPHRSVGGNLRYGSPRTADREGLFDDVVARLGLGPLLDRRVHHLSGGERRRVAIGRAILSSPRTLLLDEPLTSLDSAQRSSATRLVLGLCGSLDLPALYVSHDLAAVQMATDDLLVIAGGAVTGQGRIEELARDHALWPTLRGLGPANAVSARFIASHPGGIAEFGAGADAAVRFRAGAGHAPGAHAWLTIRPEDIALAPQRVSSISIRNQLPGRVTNVTSDDARAIVELDVGITLLAELTPHAVRELELRPERAVFALIKTSAINVHTVPESKAQVGGCTPPDQA